MAIFVIYGRLNEFADTEEFKQYKTWHFIGNWVGENLNPSLADGIHWIDEARGIYVDVHTKTTDKDPGPEAALENHKEHFDIHICLEGDESIDCIEASGLKLKQSYSETKDFELRKIPTGKDAEAIKTFPQFKNRFFVIPPNVAHRPNIRKNSKTIRKAVIKVPRHLLEDIEDD